MPTKDFRAETDVLHAVTAMNPTTGCLPHGLVFSQAVRHPEIRQLSVSGRLSDEEGE